MYVYMYINNLGHYLNSDALHDVHSLVVNANNTVKSLFTKGFDLWPTHLQLWNIPHFHVFVQRDEDEVRLDSSVALPVGDKWAFTFNKHLHLHRLTARVSHITIKCKQSTYKKGARNYMLSFSTK